MDQQPASQTQESKVCEADIVADLIKAGIDPGLVQDCTAPGPKDDPYPDYNPAKTWVLSGPLGEVAQYKGTRYPTWQEAEKAVRKSHNVVAFWVIGQRWFARVKCSS